MPFVSMTTVRGCHPKEIEEKSLSNIQKFFGSRLIPALPVVCGRIECGFTGVSAFRARGKGVRVGYFDCFSGIAGDMTLAALVDAGIDRRAIQEAVTSLGLPCELTFDTVRRGGMRATYAKVTAPHEHVHRHWHHIEAIIDKSVLTTRQQDLAKRIFLKLGEAEAKVHGVELAKIHFHEVGAVDSIVDIVGSAVGLDLLGVDRFLASPVPTGRGWVKAAHGRMPLPRLPPRKFCAEFRSPNRWSTVK